MHQTKEGGTVREENDAEEEKGSRNGLKEKLVSEDRDIS
jgi:hypothetical protein